MRTLISLSCFSLFHHILRSHFNDKEIHFLVAIMVAVETDNIKPSRQAHQYAGNGGIWRDIDHALMMHCVGFYFQDGFQLFRDIYC